MISNRNRLVLSLSIDELVILKAALNEYAQLLLSIDTADNTITTPETLAYIGENIAITRRLQRRLINKSNDQC